MSQKADAKMSGMPFPPLSLASTAQTGAVHGQIQPVINVPVSGLNLGSLWQDDGASPVSTSKPPIDLQQLALIGGIAILGLMIYRRG